MYILKFLETNKTYIMMKKGLNKMKTVFYCDYYECDAAWSDAKAVFLREEESGD